MAESIKRTQTALLIFTAVLMLVKADSLPAEIYKYQKDGIWYFSDTLPGQTPDNGLKVIETTKDQDETQPGSMLMTDFPARNPIEKATAATVAIRTTMGFGSGFFISENGHIITNKHVVRPTEEQEENIRADFEKAANQLQAAQNRLKHEEQQLRSFKTRLTHLQQTTEQESNSQRKQSLQKDYEENNRRFLEWQKDFFKRQQQIAMGKNHYDNQRHDYEYEKTLANMSTRFTIILADQGEFTANLVSLGRDIDLALLKIDGVRTPFLESAAVQNIVQGDPVFAIGSPAKLQNSVTSGVFSGFEQGYLQTNAQIYPGNSGGPLVTDEGQVIGINTFKKITHKYEGLGFAIPITAVWREFGDILIKKNE